MTYTVDEVSDLVGVPRPTLYRYLREYSIPHLRHSGKIYVPEESFDQIKEVRELHKEGLATESVRKRLQEESSFDIDELMERLDRISEALEGLQGNPKLANGVSSAQALQTILERQSLLISGVSNLSKMLEDLLHTNGQPHKASVNPEEETREQKPLSQQLKEVTETNENAPSAKEPATEASLERTMAPSTAPTRHGKRFGAMAKRRRRGALAVLLALLTSAALVAYALPSEEGAGLPQEETSEAPQKAPVGSEEVTAGDSDAAPSAPASREEQEPTEYSKEGYEGSAPEQPLRQTQYAAPEPFPQEQPVLQPQLQPQLNAPGVTPPPLR